MSFPIRERLRRDTASEHARLDAALGSHDLADPAGYTAFLRVHARALPPLEAALADHAPWADWHPRAPALIADLGEMAQPLPPPLAIAAPASPAEAWGMLYVLEGSRLGGALLATRVADGLPHAYLSHRHAPGEWRAFLGAMEAALTDDDLPAAIAGADAAFALFAAAAVETTHG